MNSNEELQLVIAKMQKNLIDLKDRLELLDNSVTTLSSKLSTTTQLNQIKELLSDTHTMRTYLSVLVKDAL